MITPKQLKIIEIFRKNLGEKIMFNQIKKQGKIKSNNFLQKTLENFKKQELINSEKLGKSIVYWLNLNNKTIAYFYIIASELYNLPEKTLYKLINEISKVSLFFSLVVFGSYAKKENKRGSDLDVAVITDNEKNIKRIIPAIETVKRREIVKIHCEVFSSEEFLEMLNSEKENVGKEILRNHIVFYNPYSFYKLIKGYKHESFI